MLSQGIGYAITALGFIAAGGNRPILVKDIAEKGNIPAPYLAKIINALAKRGIVLTQRGVGGGVTLARPANEISLRELCIAMDDPSALDSCMLGNTQCSDDRACPAHTFWCEKRAQISAFLASTSVADVGEFEKRRQGPGFQP